MTVLLSYKLKVAQIRLRRRHMYPLRKTPTKDNNNSWSSDCIVFSDLKGARLNAVDRVGSLTSFSTLKKGSLNLTNLIWYRNFIQQRKAILHKLLQHCLYFFAFLEVHFGILGWLSRTDLGQSCSRQVLTSGNCR